jgi:protein-S-isoprenylcysteine O-methyltransferase Ste14
MPISFGDTSLVTCFVACGYLSYLCFTSPNPPPAKPYAKDRLGYVGANRIKLRKWMFVITFGYMTALVLLPEYHSKICLNPDLLNPDLITWSWYTSSFVGIVLVSAAVRLRAYARLGRDFTFVLAKPDTLITTGIYHYVQHPSYTGLIVLNCAWYWIFMRLDGAAACVLPSWIVGSKVLTLAPAIVMTLVTVFGIRVRVKDEEEMLHKAFGREWEEYHAKTKRFIPGVL